jgi:hypothetical protein
MRVNDLHQALRYRPFRPFRLHLTDGTVFDVSHPELAIAGQGTLTLTLPPALGLQREAVIDMLHIMWLELLVPPPAPGPAGAGEGPGAAPGPGGPSPSL